MSIGLQCFICAFAVVINKVSPQVTVEGVIGGSVVLPCLSTKDHLDPQDINVYWRHNESMVVCDIVNGEDTDEEQDPQYKNRVESFREYYLRGNFSIKLKDLQRNDTGDFSCFITYAHDHKTVQLIIKEPKENDFTPEENEGDGVGDRSTKIGIVIGGIVIMMAPIAIIIVFICFKKRPQAPELIPVSTVPNN